MTGFSFAYDWLREWREFSEPITERRKAVPKQSWQIFLDTQLKIAFLTIIGYNSKPLCLAFGTDCQ